MFHSIPKLLTQIAVNQIFWISHSQEVFTSIGPHSEHAVEGVNALSTRVF